MNAVIVMLLVVSAGAPESALVVDPVAAPGDVDVGAKLAELLRVHLEQQGTSTLSSDELLARAGSTGESQSLVKAKEALALGKEQYLKLETAAAVKTLADARRGFQRALLETGVFEPYAEALAYQGAAFLDLENEAEAERAFLELVRVRPQFHLDAAVYPPQVLEAFERAKQKAGALPRASLQVVSAPPLARVVVDGIARGETPLTVSDLLEGPHALRVEREGRSPWWGMVDVAKPTTRVEVKLEQEALAGRLAAFHEGLTTGARVDDIRARGDELLAVARVDALVAVGLEARPPGFVVAAALLAKGEPPRVAWTVVDADLFHADDAVAALVRALRGSTSDIPVFAASGVAPPPQGPRFEESLLGVRSGAPRVAALDGRPPPRLGDAQAAAGPAAADDGSALVWIGGVAVGGVVLAALLGGAGLGVWALLQPAEEIREPDTVSFEIGVRQ